MKSLLTGVAFCLGALLAPAAVSAVTVTYIDEASFLNDLNALGHSIAHEGFENDVAWGSVRSSNNNFVTAPSITSQGLTWSSSNPVGGITTGMATARTGDWGFYAYPHGSYASDGINGLDCTIPGECGDGFIGATGSGEMLFGIGGWIRTNTPPAELGMFVDGTAVDFGESCDSSGENCVNNASLSGTAFFGVIDTAGFSSFEFRDLEGTHGDQKYLFGDDFYFAGTAAVVPVPATVWLFGSGLVSLFGYSLSRKGTS